MSPVDFTNELLIGWGGAEVFNRALQLARRSLVMKADWDEVNHTLTGHIDTERGYEMQVKFDVLDDGTVISHCPCRMNQEQGKICQHVVATGLLAMLQAKEMPEEKTDKDFKFPPEALATQEQPVNVKLVAEYFEEDGCFSLFPVLDVEFEHRPMQDRFVVHGERGYVFSAGRWFPIARVVTGPFQSVYTKDEFISREAMPAFLRNNLPILRRMVDVEISPTEDMFRFVPDMPVIRAVVFGSRASLSIIITACYGEQKIALCAASALDAICRPDPDDFLLYHVRNLPAERAALDLAKTLHFADGVPPTERLYITEPREVLNFLGMGLAYLRRAGWHIDLDERLERVMETLPVIVPVVKVQDAPYGAFDVSYAFDAGGNAVDAREVQLALNRGDSYIMSPRGTMLIDTDAVNDMRRVFSECSAQGGARPGSFRVANIYAPYVRASLLALDAVDFEDEEAPNWREVAAARNRDEGAKFEQVPLGPLDEVLRPYQKQGVYWMRFLEKSGLCGLLADEMGLGKTLQTLTWISLERCDPAARGKPAMVVCPTSLVQNWAAEAAKFIPSMRVLVISGADRANDFPAIKQHDLVITSYALLQRDFAAAYANVDFSVVVLDEAQHIKNRQTRNAKAAKQLRAVQKLVLTGTPVENSVADVWSIFDFLLPGYLGDYESFKVETEEPIALGGADGRAAQEKLHRKLHPFILRRLKKDVAKDLPDKIVRVAYCPMSIEQQRLYNNLLDQTRTSLGNMVKEKGFAKSKFEILAALMRLRQVASHAMLLKEFREAHPALSNSDTELSGKMDSFFELLDEAIDGGHRVLVFSQFVAMLTILRIELEKRSINYCYLDGSTKDRLGECRRFNTDESIPLFLISLHAGGTGLNLTGADMVVHFDPWWNPAVEDQATDRAHRIGQKRTVYVVKMIAQHSIEERVLALQQKKQSVIDATINASDESILSNLSFDDLRSLLS